MSLRLRLVSLVLAVLVPAVLAATVGIAFIYSRTEESLRQSVRETARALALLVDREFTRRDAILTGLAASPMLNQNDLGRFYDHARQLAQAWDNVIILQDAGGRQLMNTRVPLGDPLSDMDVFATWRRDASQHNATLISDLYMAPVGGRYSFAVQKAVLREGKVAFHIGIGSFASQLQSVFDQQRLPPGWLGVILDRQGTVVARSMNPELFVGQPSRPEHIRALASGHDGFFETTTLDGKPVVAFFSRVPSSDWTFVIGVPRSEIGQGALRAVAAVAAVAVMLFVLALLLVARAGRKIAQPVRQLADAAEQLGRGEAVAAVTTGLTETDRVGWALMHASERIRGATATMERRVAEAVAETERTQSVLMQTQKLEALGRLTGGIAHDFNNLLQTLTTGLKVVEMLSPDPRAKNALESCKRALDRAVRLTRQLMAFGRNQSSQAQTLDLRDQLLAMEDLLKGALRSNIALRLQVSPDLWPVYVDPLQLELAVLNLCLNARDAMPGGGKLVVNGRNVACTEGEVDELPAADYVVLRVEDTGEGMSKEVMRRALDPFFTTKPVGEGSGLGLAQVYGFARQAGGTLQLASEPGQGTCASLYLPRTRSVVQAPEPAAPSAPASTVRAHVLLVEDDILVRDIVAPALEGLGFDVATASNASQALAIIDANPRIEVVFTDIVMPGEMSGVDLAEELRERRPGLPVVLATGYSQRAATETGLRTIAKPYNVEDVAAILREELRRAQAMGALVPHSSD
jgi:signal transduction histidine kinase/ActR/RegA family two-component response regulator